MTDSKAPARCDIVPYRIHQLSTTTEPRIVVACVQKVDDRPTSAKTKAPSSGSEGVFLRGTKRCSLLAEKNVICRKL